MEDADNTQVIVLELAKKDVVMAMPDIENVPENAISNRSPRMLIGRQIVDRIDQFTDIPVRLRFAPFFLGVIPNLE
jgi:hypothetical protein